MPIFFAPREGEISFQGSIEKFSKRVVWNTKYVLKVIYILPFSRQAQYKSLDTTLTGCDFRSRIGFRATGKNAEFKGL